MSETRARIATELADLHAVDDLAHLGFELEGPAWQNRARRLSSARRSAADRWLIEADGRPAAALLCYPLELGRRDGSHAQGFGLGAVTTHPEMRRRGLAAALCRHVAAYEAQRGRHLGLLFSGIEPRYYGRLGYGECAAWDWACTRLDELASSGEPSELHAVDPRREAERLCALYAEHHVGQLHLRRDAAGWERSLQIAPDHGWFVLGDPAQPRGYVRVSFHPKGLDLMELIVAAEEQPAVLRRLAAMALELELGRLWTWASETPFLREWFEDKGRSKTLPMVSGAPGAGASQFWPTDYF